MEEFKKVKMLNPVKNEGDNERLITDKSFSDILQNDTDIQDKVMQILDKKDLNIHIKITDKSLAELLASNEELQNEIIEVFNKNKDKF